MATIPDVMTPEPLTVGPGSSLEDALDILIEHKVSGLPVVDQQGQIVGVVSEKDLLRLFYEDVRFVADIMTPDPVSVAADDPLVEVMDIMMANDFRRVLVHDGHGKLVGLISRADLLPAVLEALRERGQT